MSVACLFQVTLQRYEDNMEQPNELQDYFVFFPDFVLLLSAKAGVLKIKSFRLKMPN